MTSVQINEMTETYEGPEGRPETPKGKLSSYKGESYSSEHFTRLLRDREQVPTQYTSMKGRMYKTSNILPDWISKTNAWQNTKGLRDGSNVAEIFRLPIDERTVEQSAQLVNFLMAEWKTARVMGLKKCTQMLNVFKYMKFLPGEAIITEGEVGLTFYIIISGETAVHKDGIGVVAHLGRGKSFGELALAKGDVRTASILAVSQVEVLSLHKGDYDHFIKDIQSVETRENFYLLKSCSLFASWPRAKLEKLNGTCSRQIFEAGAKVFQQGDLPDKVYIIMDGQIEIVKEVVIESMNKWPTNLNSWETELAKEMVTAKGHNWPTKLLTWETSIKRITHPVKMATLEKGKHFGEVSILYNRKRNATATAITRSTLLLIDKLEFMHIVNNDNLNFHNAKKDKEKGIEKDSEARWPKDAEILKSIGHISGGPGSFAAAGDAFMYPNQTAKSKRRDRERARLNLVQKKEMEKQETIQLERDRRKTKLMIRRQSMAAQGVATNCATGAKDMKAIERLKKLEEEEAKMKEKARIHDEKMKAEQDKLDKAIKKKHKAFKDQYEDRMKTALMNNSMQTKLFDHSQKVTNTAEKQAELELENANRILLESSSHKEILDDPLARIRGRHKRVSAFAVSSSYHPLGQSKSLSVL